MAQRPLPLGNAERRESPTVAISMQRLRVAHTLAGLGEHRRTLGGQDERHFTPVPLSTQDAVLLQTVQRRACRRGLDAGPLEYLDEQARANPRLRLVE